MNLKEKVDDLNSMILSGQNMEAFEKYYHDEVVMQENNAPPTMGKLANREREKQAITMVEQFHGAELKSVLIGDNLSMVEWAFDMTYKGGHRVRIDQVAVQKWKDGMIVNERFYYSGN